jgi:hypothetical protein
LYFFAEAVGPGAWGWPSEMVLTGLAVDLGA